MTKLSPNLCPCCKQTLIINHLHCEQCGTNVSGSFISSFHQFSEDELLFIRDFVLNSGKLKLIALKMDKSYPTIRKMLNRIINKIE